SWEQVTAVDGPGTRMTQFLAGCVLRCKYCHNHDTWKMRDVVAHTVDEVMERITRYQHIFKTLGGGVTISGGEPLMQPAFDAQIFRSEEHTSELHHVAISYAVFCLKAKIEDSKATVSEYKRHGVY